MSDMEEGRQTEPRFEPVSTGPAGGQAATQAAGFCQHCGCPLTAGTIRRVGTAVFCEPCLAARIGGAPTGSMPGYGAGPATGGIPGYGTAYAMPPSGPNPGLAALLGLIPGVGAMYNEQYAKGIVHLIVFAVLVSFSDNVNGIFGLFVAGWIFYMAIEAHHTARARRDGTPLPNPFGLNDIGERFGFGRSWPAGPSVGEVANDAATAAAAAAAQAAAGFNQPPAPPASAAWGAAPETYTRPAAAAYDGPVSAQAQSAQPFVDAAYRQAYRDAGYGPVPPGVPFAANPPYGTPPYGASVPYAPVVPVPDPGLAAAQQNRFPAGAVWLIGLGTVFLLATTGIFSGIRTDALIGLVLVGLATWIFLRKLMESGPLGWEGAATTPMRVFRAARLSVWFALLGSLILLHAFHLFSLHHSWPSFIILAGVMAVVERVIVQHAATQYVAPAPVAPAGDGIQGGN